MEYRPRPGIVLTQLCGSYVLIPSRIAFEWCKTIQRLPTLWAISWQMLEKGNTVDQLMEVHSVFNKIPESELRQKIIAFCDKLVDEGFLIKDETLTDPNAGNSNME